MNKTSNLLELIKAFMERLKNKCMAFFKLGKKRSRQNNDNSNYTLW